MSSKAENPNFAPEKERSSGLRFLEMNYYSRVLLEDFQPYAFPQMIVEELGEFGSIYHALDGVESIEDAIEKIEIKYKNGVIPENIVFKNVTDEVRRTVESSHVSGYLKALDDKVGSTITADELYPPVIGEMPDENTHGRRWMQKIPEDEKYLLGLEAGVRGLTNIALYEHSAFFSRMTRGFLQGYYHVVDLANIKYKGVS